MVTTTKYKMRTYYIRLFQVPKRLLGLQRILEGRGIPQLGFYRLTPNYPTRFQLVTSSIHAFIGVMKY